MDEKTITTNSNRKTDHIDLALSAQVEAVRADGRFYYEPMFAGHPDPKAELPLSFAGGELRFPLWVSSMTGGTELAGKINANLARMCGEFGFGMGLGSCRMLLQSRERFADFDVRDIMGSDLPLYANLGIAQIEESLREKSTGEIEALLRDLRADGLIIHVNPLQEWMQPEGDRITRAPIDVIREFTETVHTRVIVKEVGQGMGPESIRALMQLPIQALEFAAHGGTNFTKLELLRASEETGEAYAQMALVGHSAEEMVRFVNTAIQDSGGSIKCREIIISGGLSGFLDGHYLMNQLNLPSVYGHASMFLRYAKEDYEALRRFAKMQVEGLKLAQAFLKVK
ncbi:MAG: type 2 isopentenyl-diphosphate Delta-isomerase [Bacteroidetes bacterium]|nr:MAG: type 2 isopentenyl-diphosphate Delta-isomerase [Bacteroidota bacterium]